MMYNYFKRLADILASTLAIVLLSPLLVPIMIGLKFTGEGYIFYLQERVGWNNQPFRIFKFATMLKDSPNMGTGSITLRNDPRVTSMGKYLRKSKVNELPQLINVLFGHMSIVGPRPQMEVDFKAFPKHIQEKIYNVKPGITGIGSIVFRDEEKFLSNKNIEPRKYYEEKIAPYKGELEIWYQANISFLTDLKIIVITVWIILFPQSHILFKWFGDLPIRKF